MNNPIPESKIKIIKESEASQKAINHDPLFLKNVILSNNDVPNLLQLATAEFISGAIIDMHSHESMIEIFYLIYGSLELLTPDGTFLIDHGDTFVLYPKQNHGLQFLENSKIIYLNIPA